MSLPLSSSPFSIPSSPLTSCSSSVVLTCLSSSSDRSSPPSPAPPPVASATSYPDALFSLPSVRVQARQRGTADGHALLRADRSQQSERHPLSRRVQQLTALQLVEEFMLLANQSVATKIAQTFPEVALL
eukprot:758919-Hanusia_phi.AAC.1